MKLGETIQDIRKKKNLSQLEVAELSSITQTYLSQIENDYKQPSLSILQNISNSLDVPLPIIFFLSMDESDVKMEKKYAFDIISTPLRSLISDLFIKK